MPFVLWPLLLGGLALARPTLFAPTTGPRKVWLGFAILSSVPGILLAAFAYFWLWAGDGILNLAGVPLLTFLYGILSRRLSRGWLSRKGYAGALGTAARAGGAVVAAYLTMGLTLVSVAVLHFVVFGQPMDIE